MRASLAASARAQCLLVLYRQALRIPKASETAAAAERGGSSPKWPLLIDVTDDEAPLSAATSSTLAAISALGESYDSSLLLRPFLTQLAAMSARAPHAAKQCLKALPLVAHARDVAVLLHSFEVRGYNGCRCLDQVSSLIERVRDRTDHSQADTQR